MQFVTLQLPCVFAYSVVTPALSVTWYENRCVYFTPNDSLPYAVPIGTSWRASRSMPRTCVRDEFWYGVRIATSAPGSPTSVASVVVGSRTTRPARMFDSLVPDPAMISFFRTILK